MAPIQTSNWYLPGKSVESGEEEKHRECQAEGDGRHRKLVAEDHTSPQKEDWERMGELTVLGTWGIS